jgi:hypothetical protein
MPRRPRIDVPRLAEALTRPGIDSRTWTTLGRIDEDPDAILFDPGIGWIVDVTFYGSDVESDDGHPCRVLSQGAGNGAGEYIPPPLGTEVVVEFPGGDPDFAAVVVGYASNEADCRPPATVNDLPINADASASSALQVSPYDTEFKVSPHHRREHYALDRHVQARNQIIEAGQLLKLAIRDAAQSYVRGERFVQALNGWIDAVSSFVSNNGQADVLIYAAVNLLAPGTIPPNTITAVVNAIAQVAAQKTAFQTAAVAGDALSSRIKGD